MNGNIGVVVIGRNEGERLIRCLESVKGMRVVYVDSGSTDDSVEEATTRGAAVVQLDLSKPFTAARARNEGLAHIVEHEPDVEFVQFVDGDCEVVSQWLDAAEQHLREHPEVSVVCGRRRERFPKATIYNLICDIEWDTPVGEAKACGGDAMYRLTTLKQVEGFDPGFIAGEEPELCFRIREQGGVIERLDEEMTLHDAAMTKVSQWWKRALRSGYAYTLNMKKHSDKSGEKFKRKEVRSICVWGGLPFLGVLGSLFSLSLFPLLAVVAIFILQIVRVWKGSPYVANTFGSGNAFLYAVSNMCAKFPQLWGVLQCCLKVMKGEELTLVEYK